MRRQERTKGLRPVPIAVSVRETLEYPKVLARLARNCGYTPARERAG